MAVKNFARARVRPGSRVRVRQRGGGNKTSFVIPRGTRLKVNKV